MLIPSDRMLELECLRDGRRTDSVEFDSRLQTITALFHLSIPAIPW